MPCAATHQELRHGTMRGVVASVPARGPADHLELVVVTLPDDVAACVRQAPHDVQVTGGCGPVHRVGVVALLAGVYVEPPLQQQVHRRQVSLFRRRVQQRPLVRLRARVQPVWVFVEQGGQSDHVAISRRVEQLALHCQRQRAGRRLTGFIGHERIFRFSFFVTRFRPVPCPAPIFPQDRTAALRPSSTQARRRWVPTHRRAAAIRASS